MQNIANHNDSTAFGRTVAGAISRKLRNGANLEQKRNDFYHNTRNKNSYVKKYSQNRGITLIRNILKLVLHAKNE